MHEIYGYQVSSTALTNKKDEEKANHTKRMLVSALRSFSEIVQFVRVSFASFHTHLLQRHSSSSCTTPSLPPKDCLRSDRRRRTEHGRLVATDERRTLEVILEANTTAVAPEEADSALEDLVGTSVDSS